MDKELKDNVTAHYSNEKKILSNMITNLEYQKTDAIEKHNQNIDKYDYAISLYQQKLTDTERMLSKVNAESIK